MLGEGDSNVHMTAQLVVFGVVVLPAWFVNLGSGAKVDFTCIDHRFTQGGMWMYRLG